MQAAAAAQSLPDAPISSPSEVLNDWFGKSLLFNLGIEEFDTRWGGFESTSSWGAAKQVQDHSSSAWTRSGTL